MLALDVGPPRIARAGCDPLGVTVTPLPALARGEFQADLGRLLELGLVEADGNPTRVLVTVFDDATRPVLHVHAAGTGVAAQVAVDQDAALATN